MTVILIIDDDRDDIDFFCEIACELDHSVECFAAESGDEALDLLLKNNAIIPNFIFLDLNLPRMNGKQCLCKLKNNILTAHIPVIIYTTSKLQADIEETKKLGASFFLTKPNTTSELKKSLTAILQLDKTVML